MTKKLKVIIKSSSAWLLLRIWFLSKVGKFLIGKLQEEMEFRVSGLKNSQTCMNELLFNWIKFWMETKNWLIRWLIEKRFCAKKIELKGNAVDNYRPISCLPSLWKLLTGIISEHLYRFLEEKILPKEQKGCKRNSRRTKDQLLLDKAVLRDCKRISTNLAMAWIDRRKSYDMIPHSWISECCEVFGVAENTKNLLVNSMNRWKLELTSKRVSLGNVAIRRVIFQSDSLSLLLFVMYDFIIINFKKSEIAWWVMVINHGDKKTRMNQFVFKDLKLFAMSNDQIDSLMNTPVDIGRKLNVHKTFRRRPGRLLKVLCTFSLHTVSTGTVYTLSEYIAMEFGIKKCRVLVLKRGNLVKTMDEEEYK